MAWTSQHIVEAFADREAPRYLIRDRDSIYRAEVRDRLTALGVEEVLTAPQSPWQNPYAERFDWFHSTGMLESFRDFQRSASEEHADEVLRLLSLVTPPFRAGQAVPLPA